MGGAAERQEDCGKQAEHPKEGCAQVAVGEDGDERHAAERGQPEYEQDEHGAPAER